MILKLLKIDGTKSKCFHKKIIKKYLKKKLCSMKKILYCYSKCILLDNCVHSNILWLKSAKKYKYRCKSRV